jgi:hypothetical protein
MANKEIRVCKIAEMKNQISETVLGYMDLLLENGIYVNPDDILDAAIKLEDRLHQQPLSQSANFFVNDFSDTYLSSKEDL